MATRVPVQNYEDLRSSDSFIEGSLHDLNSNNSRPSGDIDGISDVDREAVSEGSLDHDEGSNAIDSYANSIQSHNVGLDGDHPGLVSNESLGTSYELTAKDISPIETSRARFMNIIVDHFISQHVVEVRDSDIEFTTQHGQDRSNKRKSGEIEYAGDPRFVLPLMYVANMYETLVHEVNGRIASLNGFREKTIGVALEAAGGLYRKIAQKFPKKGPCSFRRRELATSLETRTRFPELVVQEEKRIRFVVVNGLNIVEKPNDMPADDAQWFKRLTGRNEVAVTANDYKFYSPRHKYRRNTSNTPGLSSFPEPDNSSPTASPQGFSGINQSQNQQQTPPKQHIQQSAYQSQFSSMHQTPQECLNHNQYTTAFPHSQQCGQPSHLPEIAHAHHSPTISQNMASLQPLAGNHLAGRLHMMPTSPAKFCDECGTPYFRETSKFCSECGTKRLGI